MNGGPEKMGADERHTRRGRANGIGCMVVLLVPWVPIVLLLLVDDQPDLGPRWIDRAFWPLVLGTLIIGVIGLRHDRTRPFATALIAVTLFANIVFFVLLFLLMSSGLGGLA